MIRPTPSRPGFTLIELIVVIAIIAVLVGLLLPAVSSITKQAERQAQRSALAGIASALEAYESDFGDYPRFTRGSDPTADDAALNESDERGARLLARALFGPAPRTATGLDATNSRADLEDAFHDGADGYGFKADRQIVIDPASGNRTFYFPGKTYGPYLEPERWNLRTLPGGGFDETVVILDINEEPVLYYPARRKAPDINSGTLFVASDPLSERQAALYNSADNVGLMDQETLRAVLGDLDNNGRINAGEEPATVGPFLLIASDPAGNYGADVVANFTPSGAE
jgi:prepilin-type N-terminal cleavage/methylation domain-containing protein